MYVTQTKKCSIEWPSFEINILEKFQIYLFTKPSSIRLEVVMGSVKKEIITTVDLDIPGELANTITSSETLFREKHFEKDITKQIRKEKATLRKELIAIRRQNLIKRHLEKLHKEKETTAKEKLLAKQPLEKVSKETEEKLRAEHERELKEKEEAEKALQRLQNEEKLVEENKIKEFYAGLDKKSPIQGSLLYKSEWHGFGPKLPPASLDKFEDKKGPTHLNTNRIDITNMNQMYDLNDPRNELIIHKLRELKNQQINDTLQKDAGMPFNEVESLRQRLYRLRLSEAELNEFPIPLTHQEILQNKKLIQFLENDERALLRLEQAPIIENISNRATRENLVAVESFPIGPDTTRRIRIIKEILLYTIEFVRHLTLF